MGHPQYHRPTHSHLRTIRTLASCALRPFGLSQRHTRHTTTSATATAAAEVVCDGNRVGGIGIGNGAIGRISSDSFGFPCFGISLSTTSCCNGRVADVAHLKATTSRNRRRRRHRRRCCSCAGRAPVSTPCAHFRSRCNNYYFLVDFVVAAAAAADVAVVVVVVIVALPFLRCMLPHAPCSVPHAPCHGFGLAHDFPFSISLARILSLAQQHASSLALAHSDWCWWPGEGRGQDAHAWRLHLLSHMAHVFASMGVNKGMCVCVCFCVCGWQ